MNKSNWYGDKYTVVFAVDDKYVRHLLIALESFCEFHDVQSYMVRVIHSGLSQKNISLLATFSQQTGLEILPHAISNPFSGIKTGYHFNTVIFLRLAAAAEFPEAKRLVYIDADVVFQASIEPLFQHDLGDSDFAAVERSYAPVPAHMHSWCREYFASGLLVINVPKIARRPFVSECIEWLNNNHYDMPDQDVFNALAHGIVKLPAHFSVETEFILAGRKGLSDFPPEQKVVIWQLSTGDKPWNVRSRNPQKSLYWRYRRQYAARLPLLGRVRLQFPDGVVAHTESIIRRIFNSR